MERIKRNTNNFTLFSIIVLFILIVSSCNVYQSEGIHYTPKVEIILNQVEHQPKTQNEVIQIYDSFLRKNQDVVHNNTNNYPFWVNLYLNKTDRELTLLTPNERWKLLELQRRADIKYMLVFN